MRFGLQAVSVRRERSEPAKAVAKRAAGARPPSIRLLGVLLAVLAGWAGGCGKVASDSADADPTATCTPPAMLCGKTCTSISSDPRNCGACDAPCPEGESCNDGACSGSDCPGGQIDCGGLCTDARTNPINCGSCSVACAPAETCVDGSCECPEGSLCDGVCTSLLDSEAHCGRCGNACAASKKCNRGECKSQCPTLPTLLTACGDRCVDARTDKTACGDCNTVCGPVETCEDGRCVCPEACGDSCPALATDPSNCGKCGNVCPADTRCESGECHACLPGLFYCPPAEGDPLAACLTLAQAASEANGAAPPVDLACQCNHCLAELDDCANDPACVAAWQCSRQQGCTTPCWETMGVCSFAVGGCWKFCPPSDPSMEAAIRATALLRCTHDNGCGG